MNVTSSVFRKNTGNGIRVKVYEGAPTLLFYNITAFANGKHGLKIDATRILAISAKIVGSQFLENGNGGTSIGGSVSLSMRDSHYSQNNKVGMLFTSL